MMGKAVDILTKKLIFRVPEHLRCDTVGERATAFHVNPVDTFACALEHEVKETGRISIHVVYRDAGFRWVRKVQFKIAFPSLPGNLRF
jgi:hypothetical protein